ncbi:MAG: amino acid permease [Planctomycetota bacterium]|jgi:amino acid transporter
MPHTVHIQRKRFGTFGGVFTPCTLTILGVIMFLRTGYVVGNAGLIGAFFILLLAKVITILTSLSLSAVATNQKVKGGGAYFLISRSLGVEFGGSIGIAFFVAQAISVALYIIGFTEAFIALMRQISPETLNTFTHWCASWMPGGGGNAHANLLCAYRFIGTIICIVLGIVTFIGAGWAIKLQYLILASLLFSVGAFLVGAFPKLSPAMLAANLAPNVEGGWKLDVTVFRILPALIFTQFGIFFPAVTGVMAGANMSGDLKNPSKAIPRGTFLAMFFTFIIYTLTMLLLAGCFSRDALTDTGRSTMMGEIAAIGWWTVYVGVFAATLSSALGSFMGAPRILQAVGRDHIFKTLNPFGYGSGPNEEPRRAVIVTFIIAEAGILLGDLNAIAPVITMFFLITYGMLNFAAFYEGKAENPSFRPTFRFFHWGTGLAGAISCTAVMFIMNWLWALVALVFIYVVYRMIERKEIVTAWGDAKDGMLFKRARNHLLALEKAEEHPKNWRPKILVISGNPANRPNLIKFANWLECQRGLLIIANIIVATPEKALEFRTSFESQVREYLTVNNIRALSEAVVTEDFESGFTTLVQAAGVGRLKPNTVCLGWSEDPDKFLQYAASIRHAIQLNNDVLVVRARRDIDLQKKKKLIDVWWRGMENGNLMIIYAYLLTQNEGWRNSRIRVLRIVKDEGDSAAAEKSLKKLLVDARVNGKVEVICSQEKPPDVIYKVSSEADLVFLGMEMPPMGWEKSFMEKMGGFLQELPNTILVKSSGRAHLTV